MFTVPFEIESHLEFKLIIGKRYVSFSLNFEVHVRSSNELVIISAALEDDDELLVAMMAMV